MPQGSSPPLHVHHRDNEAWYVLDGIVTYQVGEETLTADAGSFVWAPRGLPHSFRVDSPTARLLMLNLPGGFEEFFTAIGSPAAALTVPVPPDEPPQVEMLARVAAQFGCEVVGPPIPPPAGGPGA